MPRILLFITISLGLGSCLDKATCVDTMSDNVEMEFYSKQDGTSFGLIFDSIYVKNPIVVLYKDDVLSNIDFPLSPTVDESTIIFQTASDRDSIILSYLAVPKLYSEQCDVEIEFSDYVLEQTSFDSLQLFLTEIPPRVEIYF